MAARKEITKKYAREYVKATKKDRGRRKGAARTQVRKPRAPTYGYDVLKVLIEVWTLIGEPCG